MYSPLEPADLPWAYRLVSRCASSPVAWTTRFLWRRARARTCTFPPGRLADRIWAWNRRMSRLPRRRSTLRRVRFAGGIHMEMDLARLTDALALSYGLGESEVGVVFRRVVRPGDAALDVGGNIGTAALDFARACPGATVHVFEPSPDMRAALQRNLALNRFPNVQVHAHGLGARDGRFWLQRGMEGNPGADYVVDHAAAGACEIELRRLDALSFTQEVSFIKLDVEGYESAVLEGGRRCVAQHHPLLILERNDAALARAGASWRDLEHRLHELGYLPGQMEFGRWRSYAYSDGAAPALHNVVAVHPDNPRHARLPGAPSRR